MLHALPLVLRKFQRVIFYFSWLCPVQLTLFCAVAGLKVPAMTAYDVATKVLDKELFSQHNIAGLNSGITFIVLFSQEKPLRRKKINTNTHTHTHTHTHTQRKRERERGSK